MWVRPWRRRVAGTVRSATRRARRIVLVPLISFVLDLLMFSHVGAQSGASPARIVVPYAAVGSALLIWRRTAPVTVFALSWVHTLVAALTPSMNYYPTMGMLVSIYAVTLYRRSAVAYGALLAYSAISVFVVVDSTAGASSLDVIRIAVIASAMMMSLGIAAMAAGRLALTSRRLGQAEAREAISAERMRIARELHDIVAHSVTVMVLQAGGARNILRTNPAQAGQALAQLSQVGRQAMDELRRLLQVLRTGDPTDHSGPLAGPQPGLAGLDALLDSMRQAGLDVSIRTDGLPGRLDASVDLTAYRIVQEALTNITKHAPQGTSATVHLSWSSQRLTIQVTNDSTNAMPPTAYLPSGGYGLIGLRERATLADGDLTAGPTVAGGFRVTANLPVAQSHDSFLPAAAEP